MHPAICDLRPRSSLRKMNASWPSRSIRLNSPVSRSIRRTRTLLTAVINTNGQSAAAASMLTRRWADSCATSRCMVGADTARRSGRRLTHV
eukprot:3401854-Pleurochrysis_carterae.AAC.2